MTKKKLTDKEKRFIEEYCVDLNATQAAIRAGYSEKSARQTGSENLSKPYIRKAIDEHLDKHSLTTQEALKLLTKFAKGDMSDFVQVNGDGEPAIVIPVDEDGQPLQEAVSVLKKIKVTQNKSTSKDGDEHTTVRTEVELQDQQAAIEKILKARKVYTDGLDLKLNVDKPAVINIVAGGVSETR